MIYVALTASMFLLRFALQGQARLRPGNLGPGAASGIGRGAAFAYPERAAIPRTRMAQGLPARTAAGGT